jgi:hypothetical protein
MRQGQQLLLIRKGGIREEGGVFTINDPEFFLLPTYEHQNAHLLQPASVPRLEAIQALPHDPHSIRIDAYAVVDTILVAKDEEQVNAVAHEHIWNPSYVKMRFDFNPYDPLYLLILRVYCLPAVCTLAMRPDYVGCKSWVTLERTLSTQDAVPAVPDAEFARRRAALLQALRG